MSKQLDDKIYHVHKHLQANVDDDHVILDYRLSKVKKIVLVASVVRN